MLARFVFTLSLTLLCWYAQAQAPSEKPNILFCIADDASFDHLSVYGGGSWIHTPNIAAIANDGLMFLNAYTPNAKCSPSRACILTGRNIWQLEEAGNHVPNFPQKFTTFMEALSKNGYAVGYTGKGWSPGNPGMINGKSRELTGPAFNTLKVEAPTSEISPTDYTANLELFLKEKPKGVPFCFWFGAHEPHRAYEFGSGISKGNKKLSDIPGVPPFWPDNDTVRTDMLDYAYEVEYFDYHLGKMLKVLEAAGQLENTLVVVTSDNGMPFPRVKGHVYAYDNHLPLIVMWKSGIRKPGRKIRDYVSFIDFAPTFLELAGVDPAKSGMQPITGKSLVPILKSPAGGQVDPSRDHVLLGRERNDVGRPGDAGYPVRAIVRNGFMYARNYEPSRWPSGNPETGYLDTDGSPTKTQILRAYRKGVDARYWNLAFAKRGEEELYRIETDPYCMTNVADDPRYFGIKQALKEQMERELKEQGDPRMFGKGKIFDEYAYAHEAVRNFYERYMKGEKLHAGWVSEGDFEPRR